MLTYHKQEITNMELNIEKLSDLVMQILVLVLPYFAVLVGRWIYAKYKIARGQLS